MITIITPTIRPKGLELVLKALKQQTYKNFEWLIVSPIKIHPYWDCTLVAEPPKKEGDVWSLNKGYNAAIKMAKGDLIVSWQDWTYARPDTLEKMWAHFQNEPKTLIGAVGNKYKDNTWQVMTWKDPRERSDQGSFYQCYPADIEWNLCAVPKQALLDVGGFDEELDRWYGMDGYSVNDRIDMIGGYDFKLDQTIKTYSLEHKRPKDWEKKNALHGPYQERKRAYLANPKLPYLK